MKCEQSQIQIRLRSHGAAVDRPCARGSGPPRPGRAPPRAQSRGPADPHGVVGRRVGDERCRHPPVHGTDDDRAASRPAWDARRSGAHRIVLQPSEGRLPHLTSITDPPALDAELAHIRTEYNTIRLHAAIGYVTPDDEHEGRGPQIRRAPRRRTQAPSRRADQAESSPQDMTRLLDTDRALLPLGKRSAFEGVARRHGRRQNPARSTLRTPTNRLRHSSQRWVEKCGGSIKGSETPRLCAKVAGNQSCVSPTRDLMRAPSATLTRTSRAPHVRASQDRRALMHGRPQRDRGRRCP